MAHENLNVFVRVCYLMSKRQCYAALSPKTAITVMQETHEWNSSTLARTWSASIYCSDICIALACGAVWDNGQRLLSNAFPGFCFQFNTFSTEIIIDYNCWNAIRMICLLICECVHRACVFVRSCERLVETIELEKMKINLTNELK